MVPIARYAGRPTILHVRLPSIAGLLGLAVFAAAQDISSATKKDLILPSSQTGIGGGVGIMQLIQMLLAVAIVIALLKFALPKLVPLLGKKLNPSLGSSIKVEESAAFAGGNLYVVSVRSKTLLLSVGQQGVSCLADLTPIAGHKDEPAFFELLDQARSRSPKLAVHAVAEPEPQGARSPGDILQALARLERIAK